MLLEPPDIVTGIDCSAEQNPADIVYTKMFILGNINYRKFA